MNEVTHTPGPWHTHHEGFSTVYIEARIGGGMLQEVASCGPTIGGSDQQEANARLIAAAPDLLAALIRVISVADRKTDEFDEAHAAITKATGQ